jgi:hypothetical protein
MATGPTHPTHESISALTAASAAVQQVPVEPANLLKISAGRKCKRPADLLRHSAVIAMAEATRNIAKVKNVTLEPGLDERLAAVAVDTLDAATLCRLMRAEPGATIGAAAIINRMLDICAASRVISLLWNIYGFENVDPAWAMTQAEAWMKNVGIANEIGDNRYRWPDAAGMVIAHYKARSYEPVRIQLPADYRMRAFYQVDREAIRRSSKADALQGPVALTFRCSALPENPHALRPDGRRVKAQPDGTVETSYWLGGKLHRPSLEGPAFSAVAKDGTCTFELYSENGQPHRDPALGPARINRNGEDGLGFVHEYFWRGVAHRDPAEGPAWHCRDAKGERLEYVAHGQVHRASADGPAVIEMSLEGNVSRAEYIENNRRHRDPVAGPAVITHDTDGRATIKEYWRDGELIENHDQPAPNRRARRASKKRTGNRKGAGQ